MRIPKEIETKVVTKLYADAGRIDWANMTPQQHSVQYSQWVADPQVGGLLGEFLSDSDTRVWIKDGPMKEWSRSLSGIGKYATLVAGSEDIPTQLVRKVLGVGWAVDPSTIRTKPLRLLARNGEDETVLTWAPSRDLKHLVWAALKASAEGDTRTWVVCVIETFTKPAPSNEKLAHQRLAKRCGLQVVHVPL